MVACSDGAAITSVRRTARARDVDKQRFPSWIRLGDRPPSAEVQQSPANVELLKAIEGPFGATRRSFDVFSLPACSGPSRIPLRQGMRSFSSGIVKSAELDLAMPRKRFLKDTSARSLEGGLTRLGPGSMRTRNSIALGATPMTNFLNLTLHSATSCWHPNEVAQEELGASR